ncbi:MAG: hypothetical protein B6U97_03485 [Candidatus Altiarchaeales archaeon ex4484_96]|nr:MAG: hypothetical protein B6U97_03485 [Candidatus Altiarchaeales archaeon ex4484_96]
MPPTPLFDLSWLWDTLTGVVDRIQNFFDSLVPQMMEITNTGQGIFQGLVHFGSQIWDAITKGLDVLGEWIQKAYEWIQKGLDILGSWIKEAFKASLEWIGSGIAWVGNQIYNFGWWLWSGIVWIAKQFWRMFVNVVNFIVNVFRGLITQVGEWWDSVADYVNAWWTNLMVSFRNKLFLTITADISLYQGWKATERVVLAKSWKDWAYGFAGLLLAPLTGAIFGAIMNSFIPSSTHAPIEIIPKFSRLSITAPDLALEVEPYVEHPTDGEVGGQPWWPPEWPTGLIDLEAEIKSSYEWSWRPATALHADVSCSYSLVLTGGILRDAEAKAEYSLVLTAGILRDAEVGAEGETLLVAGISREAEISSNFLYNVLGISGEAEISSSFLYSVSPPFGGLQIFSSFTAQNTSASPVSESGQVLSSFLVAIPIFMDAEVGAEYSIVLFLSMTKEAEITASYQYVVVGLLEREAEIKCFYDYDIPNIVYAGIFSQYIASQVGKQATKQAKISTEYSVSLA